MKTERINAVVDKKTKEFYLTLGDSMSQMVCLMAEFGMENADSLDEFLDRKRRERVKVTKKND